MSDELKQKSQKGKQNQKPKAKSQKDKKAKSYKGKSDSSLATVVSINISERKTVRKKPVEVCKLLEEHGLEKDAHAGDWHRQVSLLALESIEKMREMGLEVKPGDFAENITTQGIELVILPIGTRVTIGDKILLEVTQIGKVCHTKCAIYYQAGDCIMPKEGIFARVLKGGEVKVGDKIKVLDSDRSD